MKYTYVISRTVVQMAHVVIEADSESAADQQARRITAESNSKRCPELDWWVDESLTEGYSLIAQEG
jgi:hypothetical protein